MKRAIAKELPAMVPVEPLRRANKTYISDRRKRLAILRPKNFILSVAEGGPIDPMDTSDIKAW